MNNNSKKETVIPSPLPEQHIDGFYLKTLCQLCDGEFEFPADGLGMTANCPHCGQMIALGMPSDNETQNPPLSSDFVTQSGIVKKDAATSYAVSLVCFVAVLIIAGFAIYNAANGTHSTGVSAKQLLTDADVGIKPNAPVEIVAPQQTVTTTGPFTDLVPPNHQPTLPDFGQSAIPLLRSSHYIPPSVLRLEDEVREEQQVRQRQKQFDQQQQVIDEMREANYIAKENASWQRFWEIENSRSQPIELMESTRPPIQPVSIYGGSTRIGDTIFHNYHSSDGQTFNGSTELIGDSAYTHLYGH